MIWLRRLTLRWGLAAGAVAGGLLFLSALASGGGREAFPLEGDVELNLLLPVAAEGTSVPLLVTGRTKAANLLYIRQTAPGSVVFGYDSWGVGGPVSPPVAVEPGRWVRLALRLPPALPPGEKSTSGWLRLSFGGRLILDSAVHHHGYSPEQVYFGHNPVGGTVTDARFRGRISTLSGVTLNRDREWIRSGLRTIWHWFRSEPLLAGLSLASAGLALLALALLARRAHAAREDWERPIKPGGGAPPHLVFGVVAGACALLFAAVISGGSFRLLATESFCRFYDDQARSILQGKIDVPPEALDGEAFVFEGRIYGYFGPTPALLRIPFAMAGVPPGRLSRAFMLAYFVACLGAAYALLIQAARLAGGAGAWPSGLQVLLLTLSTGLGSTLFFLGSRAYIYHEAILCGVAFALWSVVASVRWLRGGGGGWGWLTAFGCGWLAVHARPPAGLFALGTLGSAAAFLLYRLLAARIAVPPARVVRLAGIGLLAVAGVLSFNVLSYLKFRSFEGAPLRYNVQYGRERLRNIEGRNFHLSNVPYGLAGYGFLPSAVVRPTFPYLFMRYTEPAGFPGARIDLAENTLAIPWAMPGLTLLAFAGCLLGCFRWGGAAVPLLVLVAGFAPMALAMLAAIAQSHRYTADFVPFLVAAAAFGLAGSGALSAGLRRGLLALAACLCLIAAAVTLAITVQYQGEVVWGVDPEIKARFLALRRWSDAALGLDP